MLQLYFWKSRQEMIVLIWLSLPLALLAGIPSSSRLWQDSRSWTLLVRGCAVSSWRLERCHRARVLQPVWHSLFKEIAVCIFIYIFIFRNKRLFSVTASSLRGVLVRDVITCKWDLNSRFLTNRSCTMRRGEEDSDIALPFVPTAWFTAFHYGGEVQ